MIEFTEATITNLIFHRIGTTHSSLSTSEYPVSGEEEEILKNIFLKSFTGCTNTWEFKHEIDLELNPLFKISRAILQGQEFAERSRDIHQHLKTVSRHPNIKDGDLFVVRYDDVKYNNQYYEALGVYKIETKEHFIETSFPGVDDQPLRFRKGIGSRKLDKACLILFTEEPYTLLIIDNVSRDTDYWNNEFLAAGPKNDHVNNTNQLLTLAREFITGQFPQEYNATKADQIDFLNRSVDYFKSRESFEKEEFEREVFQDQEVIRSFRNFDEGYRRENEVEVADSFEISAQAVKKQARIFKSVIKLDKNFHIYIHGNRQLIEQGVDADGRKYYKIYFEEEN